MIFLMHINPIIIDFMCELSFLNKRVSLVYGDTLLTVYFSFSSTQIHPKFIGTFSVLAQDGGSNSAIVSLSDEVIVYEDTIRKYAKEYDIEDYVSLLQAIMMQESGGKGNE